MKLVVATRNKHKLEEIHAILAGLDVELHSALDFPEIPDVVEDGDTLKVDYQAATATNLRTGQSVTLRKFPPMIEKIFAVGGLPEMARARYLAELAAAGQTESV